MNKTIKKLSAVSLFLLVTGLFAFPVAVAFAQGSITENIDFSQPYIPLTTIPGLYEEGEATNPVTIVKGIYGLAIGIGSVIATLMIIYAGFEYMYVEAIGQKSAAKERITNAFLGLLVILGSYILLRTINPALVDFNITLEEGTGRVANLIAVQKDFDTAQARIREAQELATRLQANIKESNSQILSLDAQLAELYSAQDDMEITPEQQEEIQGKISELTQSKVNIEKSVKDMVLEEKYIRATGGLSLNVSSMEESLITGGGNNIAGNIQRGLENIAEARTALKTALAQQSSPLLQSRLAELDTQEILFRAQASQLNIINRRQNELIDDPKVAAAEIQRVGKAAVETFTKMGKPGLVEQIQNETVRRIAIVCPKCQ